MLKSTWNDQKHSITNQGLAWCLTLVGCLVLCVLHIPSITLVISESEQENTLSIIGYGPSQQQTTTNQQKEHTVFSTILICVLIFKTMIVLRIYYAQPNLGRVFIFHQSVLMMICLELENLFIEFATFLFFKYFDPF